jgi:hypothetical protein
MFFPLIDWNLNVSFYFLAWFVQREREWLWRDSLLPGEQLCVISHAQTLLIYVIFFVCLSLVYVFRRTRDYFRRRAGIAWTTINNTVVHSSYSRLERGSCLSLCLVRPYTFTVTTKRESFPRPLVIFQEQVCVVERVWPRNQTISNTYDKTI